MALTESAGVTISTERERVYITLDNEAFVALKGAIRQYGYKSVVATMIAEFAALMGVRQVIHQANRLRPTLSLMTITLVVEFSPYDPEFPGLGTLEASIREVISDLMPGS